MAKIQVKTGYGYYRNAAGEIVAKSELPPGEHPLLDGHTYIEVADKTALDAVQVYIDPADIAAAANEQKIQTEIRAVAITALKVRGELPADYQDKA